MARTVYGGTKVTFEIKLHGRTNYIDISASYRGSDGFNTTQNRGSRPIPGGGNQILNQVVGGATREISFTIDDNRYTRPIFMGGNGRRYDFRITREHDGGSQIETGEAVFIIGHNFEGDGVARFECNGTMDGAPTITTS